MNKKTSQHDLDALRKAAEDKLVDELPEPTCSAEELLHDLHVHQIELEMQNESLRQAHLAMEESRDRYVDLYDFAPVAYLTVNRDGVISEANLTAATLFGIDRNALLRHRFSQFITAEEQDHWHLFFISMKRDNARQTTELSVLRGDGSRFYAQLDGQRVQSNALNSSVRITLTDNTERRQTARLLAEAQVLAESEEKFRKISEAAQDAIIMMGADQRISSWNAAAERIFGYSVTEALGQEMHALIVPKPAQTEFSKAYPHFQRTGEGPVIGKLTEAVALRKNGDEFPVELSISATRLNEQWHAIGIVRDITKRKRQQQLEAVHTRIATIFALIADEEHFNEVLKVILEAMHSPFGVFGYIDTDGALVVPTMTRQVWDRCEVSDKAIRFPREDWGDSIWPRAIREMRGLCSNEAAVATPAGHVEIQRNIAMPVLYHGEVIGLFQVANKETDYTAEDIALLGIIAAQVAPLLHARLQQNRAAVVIEHANRALAAISKVNNALAHATDENALMQSVCHALVEQRGFRMAWAGYLRHDPDKSIEIMASAGSDDGFLAATPFIWAETNLGPSGRAVRSGVTQLCQDIAHAPENLPWREAALAHGYAAVIALPLRDADKAVFGILNVYSDQAYAFIPEEIRLLENMAGDLAFGIRALRLRQERNRMMEQNRLHLLKLQENLEDTVRSIATMVEMRDPYTAGHQRRVADLAQAIALQMGLPDEQAHGIHMAGIVHDLGKISIPAEILSKPGRINDIEFGLIQEHPQSGYAILKDIDFPWPIAQMVLQHHERIDGSGYPQGLKGDAIVLGARILTVADVVEAMASHRPYRPGLGIDAALDEIQQLRGTQFDPQVVDACLTLFKEKHYVFSF